MCIRDRGEATAAGTETAPKKTDPFKPGFPGTDPGFPGTDPGFPGTEPGFPGLWGGAAFESGANPFEDSNPFEE
eukprot:174693-Pyramimonas_sp.AAC.1